MISVRLKIGDGPIKDTQKYGLVYLSADNIIGLQQKEFEKTEYPEQEGENLLPRAADAAFDYSVKFFIKAGTLGDANTIIDAFNKELYEKSGDVKTYKQVFFYNDYKRVKIVGYPHEISEADTFWKDPTGEVTDVVVVNWTIRVSKPSLCEFKTPFSDDS